MLALPILWSLAIGQAQALVTLLLTYGTPLAVALAANIKVFPALVAIWWVGRRDWRRLGWFAAWMAGLIAFQFVLEPAATLGYIDFLRLDLVGERPEPLALRDLAAPLAGLGRGHGRRRAASWRTTRWGWPAAVVAVRVRDAAAADLPAVDAAGRLPADRTAPDGAERRLPDLDTVDCPPCLRPRH